MKSQYHHYCIVLITILLFLTAGFTQQGWNDLTPSGTYPALYDIFALDSVNIWVVGDGGTILNTTNGGTSWSEIICPVNYPLYNVYFINSDTGWVGGDNNTITEIMRTTDGGLTWELQTLAAASDYGNYDIEFILGNTGENPRGFVSAGLSLVWRTDDYGANWVDIGIGGCGANSLLSICFVDKDEGWFVGEPSATQEVSIVHTTDGGQTYEIQTNPTEPDNRLNCVSFADNQHGIAAGVGSTILFTTDGGTNWESRPVSNYRWQSVHLTQSGRAWAVGRNGIIISSTDWGYTWTNQQSGVTCELWEVIFINDDNGWIVGGGMGQPGVILHTTTGGITDIQDPIDNTIEEYHLYQNYPNPFNPKTVISWQLAVASPVRLSIYNLLGEKLMTLLNEKQMAGFHNIEWDASHLPSGIYLYRLEAGELTSVKKMILIK